jgi:hypothetical protein
MFLKLLICHSPLASSLDFIDGIISVESIRMVLENGKNTKIFLKEMKDYIIVKESFSVVQSLLLPCSKN